MMFDVHYDLLTIAYVCYLKQDYTYLEKVSHYFHDHNVKGVIANLYFMSREEMELELHPNYYQESVSVLEMFVKSKEILDYFLPCTEILYSIEGPDYIQDINELEQLYHLGLDSVVISWNTKSRYASGNRSKEGLSSLGRELIQKAILLGMGIDLSHANPQTFQDVIEVIKKEQKEGNEVCCYASHSNSRTLCDRDRNLTDEQLQELATVNGKVGVFSNRNFVVSPDKKETATKQEQEDAYLRQIDYIASIIGKKHIMVATDDMDFCKEVDSEYGEVQIYNYATLLKSIRQNLSRKYEEDTIDDILYHNAKEEIYNTIRKNRYQKGEKVNVRY